MVRTGMFVVATTLFLSAVTSADAAEYYVDPSAGSAGDGSESNPWASLQDAIDAGDVAAGDTVWLMSGDYGELSIESANNTDTITIAAANEQEPLFTSVLVRDSSDYTIPVPVLGKLAEQLVLKRNQREADLSMQNIKERLEV